MALSATETRMLMRRGSVLNYAETLKRRRRLEDVIRELLSSARTAQMPDGRVFTGIPLEFAIELALHQCTVADDVVFVAVEGRLLGQMAQAMGQEAWEAAAFVPREGTPLVAGELDQWMTETGTTNEALGARLGLAATTVNAWRRGYARINRERSAQLRALMNGASE